MLEFQSLEEARESHNKHVENYCKNERAIGNHQDTQESLNMVKSQTENMNEEQFADYLSEWYCEETVKIGNNVYEYDPEKGTVVLQ
jgi:hypothetical protein